MESKRAPEVRFAGFSGEWERKRLSDNKDVRDGTHDSPKYQKEGYPLITSKNLTSNGLDLNNVSFISIDDYLAINKRSKVDVGDILFGMIGTIGNPIIIDSDGFAIKNVALIKHGGEVQNEFLINLLRSSLFEKYILTENVGNTQKFLGLSKIRDFKFLVPNSKEQAQIGNFFKQLDEMIAIQQQELDTLKQTKQGFLQKMFPKEGESVPEVRFPGFVGNWSTVKLGDYSTIKGRLGWKSLKQNEYIDNGPSMIAGRHIKDGKIEWNEVDHIPQWRYDESPEIMLQNGDVIFSKDGSLGNPALITNLKTKATINSTMMLVRLNKSLDPLFFYQVLSSEKFKRLTFLKVSGSSIPHLFQADMKDFVLQCPSIEEQTQIGNFFKQLDNIIALHQKELDALKETKKAFLQKMFV